MSASTDTWAIVNEDGVSIADFGSIISVEAQYGGQVVSEPVERGSFATYNKTSEPISVYTTAARAGASDELQAVLDALAEVKASTDLYRIITPEQEYTSLSLESYNYKRVREDGANVLIIEMLWIEVKQVETHYTTSVILKSTQCKSADNASKVNNGKKQTTETNSGKKSVIKSLQDKVTGGGD